MRNDQIILVFGILGLLFSLLLVGIGLNYLYGSGVEDNTEQENHDAGMDMLFTCFPVFIIPSVIFFIYGYHTRMQFKEFEDVADVLKAYRRIKIADLARKLNTSEFEAEKMVLECIEHKLIHGYMDRQAGAFFTSDAMHQMSAAKSGWKCSACGGYNDSIILPGETAKCHYCGKLSAPAPGRTPTHPAPPTPMASPSPPPPIPPPPTATVCPWCRTPLVYVSQYGKWYCNRCARYA